MIASAYFVTGYSCQVSLSFFLSRHLASRSALGLDQLVIWCVSVGGWGGGGGGRVWGVEGGWITPFSR